MHTAIRTSAIGLLATAFAAMMSASGPAAATTYRDASAGAVCHAANGALATKFTYNLNFLTNVGTTDAYVMCHLPMDDVTTTPDELLVLSIEVFLPAAGSTVTCMAQTGSYFDGTNFIYKSNAVSHTAVGPNANHQLSWSGDALGRSSVHHVLSINCKLPPNAKLGLIQRWEAPDTST